MNRGPLHDVKILDLTHVWAGPLGTRVLGDLGAQIIKIERAHGRGLAVPSIEPIAGWIGGEPGDEPWNNNAAFVKLARNCKSVCLDLKNAEGRSIFLDLVAQADVVIENFSARAMPSMGLDYPALKSVNPNIIYITMPGYGTYGPYKDWVAFGPTVEPMTGLTNVMGYSSEQPLNTAIALMDPIAGISATAAVTTALRRRAETGKGVYVEMSLHESGVSLNGPWLIEHQLGGEILPIGNRHPQLAPHGVYACSGEDQWLVIACENDKAWRSLCELLDVDLDPALSWAQRMDEYDRIDATITQWTSTHDKLTAAEILQACGVAAGPVNNTIDMVEDTQALSRGFFVAYERFNTPIPGNPISMPGVDSATWTACPKLGAHNEEVLKDWLGYDDTEIASLYEQDVIADRPPA